MSIIPPKREFVLCPAGATQAVCYDVWNLGLQRGEFEGREVILPKIKIAWEVNLKQKDGRYFTVNKTYTLSYHRKANLRMDLESWMSRPMTEQERVNFDVEVMVGKNCFLSIIHKPSGERVYANVHTVMSLPDGIPLMKPTLKREIPDWIKELQDKAVSAEVHNDSADESEAVPQEE